MEKGFYLKELELKNFRQFEELTLPIHPQLTVILGENGGGKTSICDALGLCTSNSKLQTFEKITDVNAKAGYCEIEYFFNDDTKYWIKFDREQSLGHRLTKRNRFLYLSIQTMPKYFEQFKNLFINQNNYENQQIREGDRTFRLPLLEKIQILLVDFLNALGENKYSNLRVRTKLQNPEHFFSKSKIIQQTEYIQIAKNELFIDINLLSQGELQLLKLVLNIFAEQLRWEQNFSKEVPTVVIDEIDLHLHPRWQRNLLPALMKVFPEVQFIVTTHSPLIVSNIKAEHIVLLKDYKAYPLKNPTEGRDVNSILYEVFGVTKRPEKAAKMIETCGKMIEKAIDDDNWAEAKAKLDELRELFGDTDIDVVRLQAAYDFYN